MIWTIYYFYFSYINIIDKKALRLQASYSRGAPDPIEQDSSAIWLYPSYCVTPHPSNDTLRPDIRIFYKDGPQRRQYF